MQASTRAAFPGGKVGSRFDSPAARRRELCAPKARRPTSESPLGNGGAPLRRILVPIDFSEASLKAVAHAAALAREFQARVTLLHVVDISAQPGQGEPSRGDSLMEHLWAKGSARLSELAASLGDNVNVQASLTEGLPWEVIIAWSAQFDLVVLGKNFRRTRARFFCHHTARRVVENARCPVMVLNDGAAHPD